MGPFIVDTGMNTTKKITEPTGVEPLTLVLKKFSYEVLGSLNREKRDRPQSRAFTEIFSLSTWFGLWHF